MQKAPNALSRTSPRVEQRCDALVETSLTSGTTSHGSPTTSHGFFAPRPAFLPAKRENIASTALYINPFKPYNDAQGSKTVQRGETAETSRSQRLRMRRNRKTEQRNHEARARRTGGKPPRRRRTANSSHGPESTATTEQESRLGTPPQPRNGRRAHAMPAPQRAPPGQKKAGEVWLFYFHFITLSAVHILKQSSLSKHHYSTN